MFAVCCCSQKDKAYKRSRGDFSQRTARTRGELLFRNALITTRRSGRGGGGGGGGEGKWVLPYIGYTEYVPLERVWFSSHFDTLG